MNSPSTTITYRWAASVLLLIIMPFTLVIGSGVVALMDRRVGVIQALLNNGLPLYVIAALPAVLLSVVHTRFLRVSRQPSRRAVLTRSTLLGVGIGAALGVVVLAVVFGQLNMLMWPVMLWSVGTGAVYGLSIALLRTR